MNLDTQKFRRIEVKDFFESELCDFASYSTLRAIASLVDGAKNGGRKIIHTIQNNNITTKAKVANLAATVSIETEYLHGSTSLEGTLVTIARNFVGTNNLNVLYPSGNFGTRFEPEASASRYIFTYKEKVFDKIYNREDNRILLHQTFEGTDIEPRFFVPNLPMLLVNGSEGIATGFAQKILPRKVETLKNYITAYLGNMGEKPDLTPHYNGFGGIIKAGTNPNQWEILGTFVKKSLTKMTITELPIGYNLGSYTKVLDDLEDKKIIKSYIDKSNAKTDTFEFDVSVDSKFLKNTDEWILDRLKLVKTVTENFTVLDENNKVVVYNSPEEVINHYIKVKLHFLQKRKEYLIQEGKNNILILASKYSFVKNVTEEKIKINKQKKEEIVTQLNTFDDIIEVDEGYDYLLAMKIYNLTKEKMQELLEKIKRKKIELQEILVKDIKETWSEEIINI